jgi:hypothetical protein
LAQERPELRQHLLPLLRTAADKAKTEEGAKKLYKQYLDGLKDPSKSTKKPQDFFEKPEGDKGKKDKSEDKGGSHSPDKLLSSRKTLNAQHREVNQAIQDAMKTLGLASNPRSLVDTYSLGRGGNQPWEKATKDKDPKLVKAIEDTAKEFEELQGDLDYYQSEKTYDWDEKEMADWRERADKLSKVGPKLLGQIRDLTS